MTEEQQKYIIRHFKNTKNDELMAKLGINHSELHRFARAHGLKKTKQFQRKCQANATAKAREVNKRNNWPPKGYIIPGSENNRFKPGVNNRQRLGDKRNAERIKKCHEKRNATIAADRRRLLFGLEPKTKMKLILTNHNHNRSSIKHLLVKRGYISQRGSRTVYYDENTNRSIKTEITGVKHGLKILQAQPKSDAV